MTEQRALALVVESLDKIRKTGMLSKEIPIEEETILLGIGSPLDSIGFVTFVTDLEERISADAKKDLYLVLNEIHEFNINQPNLTVKGLVRYIVNLSEKNPIKN